MSDENILGADDVNVSFSGVQPTTFFFSDFPVIFSALVLRSGRAPAVLCTYTEIVSHPTHLFLSVTYGCFWGDKSQDRTRNNATRLVQVSPTPTSETDI